MRQGGGRVTPYPHPPVSQAIKNPTESVGQFIELFYASCLTL